MEVIQQIGGIAGVIVAVFGLLWLLFGPISKLREDQAAIKAVCNEKHGDDGQEDDRLRTLCLDMAVVKEDVRWLSKSLEAKATNDLHSPTHHERDALVDKLKARSISLEEMDELLPMLEEAIHKEARADARWAASVWLDRARIIRDRMLDDTEEYEGCQWTSQRAALTR